eukprot:COSAG06_NODE_15116_length_1096_cov_2.174524_1_plen_59_part_00
MAKTKNAPETVSSMPEREVIGMIAYVVSARGNFCRSAIKTYMQQEVRQQKFAKTDLGQ